MKNVGKYSGAKRYSRPRGFNIAGASASVAPAVPTPLAPTQAMAPDSTQTAPS